jgi:hypothetical protein
MGRLTEYFAYLKTPTKDLDAFKENLYHLTIQEEHEIDRKKLELYKEEK